MNRFFKLIKAYWHGFVGGPSFTRCIQHRFRLEDKQLTIDLPDSNVVATSSEIKTNIPHSSTTWFSENARTFEQHCFVSILAENWMYMPPIAFLPSSELGMLSCRLRIKQTDQINVLDTQSLSLYLTQSYDDYHHGPDGSNTELRRRVIEQSSKMATPYEPDELEKEVAEYIELQGRQPLAPAVIKSINQLTWIFYTETQNNTLSHTDYYCLPLSKHSFLEVEFTHRVDLSHKHKKWAKHGLASQEKIMNSIYLDDSAINQDPLVEVNH